MIFEDGSSLQEVFSARTTRSRGIFSLYIRPLDSNTLSCTLWMVVYGLVASDLGTTTFPRVTVPHRRVLSFSFLEI